MKFNWCTITVDDMERSVAFYRDIVGLPVARQITGGPTQITFLGDGETQVELIHNAGDKAPGHIEGISLGFSVPSPAARRRYHLKEAFRAY